MTLPFGLLNFTLLSSTCQNNKMNSNPKSTSRYCFTVSTALRNRALITDHEMVCVCGGGGVYITGRGGEISKVLPLQKGDGKGFSHTKGVKGGGAEKVLVVLMRYPKIPTYMIGFGHNIQLIM